MAGSKSTSDLADTRGADERGAIDTELTHESMVLRARESAILQNLITNPNPQIERPRKRGRVSDSPRSNDRQQISPIVSIDTTGQWSGHELRVSILSESVVSCYDDRAPDS